MEPANLAILVASGTLIGIGVLSRVIARSVFSEPVIALSVGILFSPAVLSLLALSPEDQFAFFEEAARIALAIGLMSTALDLPSLDLRRRWRTMVVLLGPVMIAMWLVSSLLVFLILGTSLASALLVGAIITPTDPVLARSIAAGELAEQNIPSRIRYSLLEESGLNDGLAFPYVVLMITVLTMTEPLPAVLQYWLVHTVLWAVLGGIILGILIGYGGGKLLHQAVQRRLIIQDYASVYPFALSLFALTLGRLVGIDGILVVFLTGLAFKPAIAPLEQLQERFSVHIFDRTAGIVVFFVLGLASPWPAWIALGWKAPLLVGAILLLRRLPTVLSLQPLMRPQIRNLREAAFAGWFGPIGISALFYASLAMQRASPEQTWAISTLIIFSSVIAFGMTDAPFTMHFGQQEKTDQGQG